MQLFKKFPLESSAGTLFLLIIGRLVLGVGCGMATVLVPIFLNEITPAERQGRIGLSPCTASLTFPTSEQA
jgi:MFS family permease